MPDYTERIEQIQAEIRTLRQIIRQTDEQVMAAQEGWGVEDVAQLRDECRSRMGELEEELAEIEGRQYTAPEKLGDGDHVRVDDCEDGLADLSELASDTDASLADLLDAIADLSADVSALYDQVEGGE